MRQVLVLAVLVLAMASIGANAVATQHCEYDLNYVGENENAVGTSDHLIGWFTASFDPTDPDAEQAVLSWYGNNTRVVDGVTHIYTQLQLGANGPHTFYPAYPYFTDFGFTIDSTGPGEAPFSFEIAMWQLQDGDKWLDSSQNSLTITCDRNSPSAVGDPAFVGFLGQSYQVHGAADTVYSIVSAPTFQLNALFVFLTQGVCPTYVGAPRVACWSHPGSYFGRLGAKTADGDQLLVQSGTAQTGFQSVVFNGQPVRIADQGTLLVGAAMNVTLTSAYTMMLYTELFTFEIENSDQFINLMSVRVESFFMVRAMDVHGLLGQTWTRRTGGQVKYLDGEVDDYAEATNDLFGDKTVYNRFIGRAAVVN